MRSASQQLQDCATETAAAFDPRVSYLLVAAYQKEGKTILQPLIARQEAEKTRELFGNKTLEVWLSNGENDIDQFDVAIVKYKQVLQPLAECQKVKNVVCMKNHIKNLVSCEQCPLGGTTGEIANDKC